MRKNDIESVIWETRSDVIMIPFILCIEWKGSVVLLAYFRISLGENPNQIPLDGICVQSNETANWQWHEHERNGTKDKQSAVGANAHGIQLSGMIFCNHERFTVKKWKEKKRSPFVVAEAIRFPPI